LNSRKKHPWYRHRGYPHFDHPIKFTEAEALVKDSVQVSKHSFYPFIEFTIESFKVKRTGPEGKLKRIQKLRPIAYASHVDCHIYSYYSLQLGKKYEQEISRRNLQDCVLAFRSLGKSNVDFAFEAFEAIRNFGKCEAIALDVTGFFDNLDHVLLKNVWAGLLGQSQLPADHYTVFKSLTKYSTVNLEKLYSLLGVSMNNRNTAPLRLCTAQEFRSKIRGSKLVVKHPLKKGIPQGSPISALLSNLYMLDYDSAMKDFVDTVGGHYFRYCDDILLIVPPGFKATVESLAVSEITKLLLDVNPKKTDRVDFVLTTSGLRASTPLQYLGFLFDGQRILLRSASLARYSERMRTGVRLAKATMRKRNAVRVDRGEAARPLFRKKLNSQYSHLGRRNFITYGYDAARRMESQAIRKQLRVLWKRLQNEIDSD
jgi:hypothetical protein